MTTKLHPIHITMLSTSWFQEWISV